ncbi:MAG: glycerophosphodiester phosphodiesterase [Christensenellaceae bacterium]
MTKVFAHRGASAYAPENTLEAFAVAIDMKADGIELDVHMTKDGIIVVCHDDSIDRTSDGKGFIGEMTLRELRAYNFHGKFVGRRFEIPTLQDVLALMQNAEMQVNVELKHGPMPYPNYEEAVLEEVARANMEAQVFYSSFDHYALARLKELDAQARTGLLYSAGLVEPWKYAKEQGAFALHPKYKLVRDAAYISEAHAAGILVNVWTVDSKKEILAQARLGVDGIITNKPDVAKAVLEEIEGAYI